MPAPHLTEAKGPQDDWTGLKDAKQRKKLQNRLNVRAHPLGKRKACLAAAAYCSTERGLAATELSSSSLPRLLYGVHLTCPTATKPSRSSRLPCQCMVRIETPGPLFQYISSLTNGETAQHYHYQHYQLQQESTRLSRHGFPLSWDHLLPLVQYNLIRAMVTNMAIVAIDHQSAICSVFWTSVVPFSTPQFLPDTLAPTPLQLATPHPRWIDLLPHPRMRDNAVLAQGHFDPAELEEDTIGDVCDKKARLEDVAAVPGLLVWTDPWRPESWEVTESFVRKWGFLLRGCDEIFRATDRWRASRGEMPLAVKMFKD